MQFDRVERQTQVTGSESKYKYSKTAMSCTSVSIDVRSDLSAGRGSLKFEGDPKAARSGQKRASQDMKNASSHNQGALHRAVAEEF